jgi:hypothetical protein
VRGRHTKSFFILLEELLANQVCGWNALTVSAEDDGIHRFDALSVRGTGEVLDTFFNGTTRGYQEEALKWVLLVVHAEKRKAEKKLTDMVCPRFSSARRPRSASS